MRKAASLLRCLQAGRARALGTDLALDASRAFSSGGDQLKAVLAEKIPQEQVFSLLAPCLLHARSGIAGNTAILPAKKGVNPPTCLPHACPCLAAQERLKALKKTYGSKDFGKVTVDMVIGGMRGITVRRSA